MSRIDELSARLCPQGVNRRSIGSLITRVRDRGKNDKSISQVYVVSNTQGIVRSEDFHDKEIHSDDTSNYTIIRPGMFAYNPSRLNIGSLGLLTYDVSGLVSPMYVVFSIDNKVINKDYLMYNLKSSYVRTKIDSLKEEGARFRFDFKRWDRIEIPVPPLEVQEEIVRILDKFKNLSLILEKELDYRKQQYKYYRNEMLMFDTNIPQMILDEVCNISAGGDAPKEEMSKEKTEQYNIPIISNGIGENAFYGYTSSPRITEPAVTVAARGTIGYAEYRDYPYFPIIRLLSVIPKDTSVLNTRYLYYCLQGKEYNVPTSGIPQLTAPMLKKVIVPVPGLSVQERIVSVLDTFEAFCSDLNIGLPAEINARQKQFEYYRDKLLNFKEAKE